MKNFNLRKFLVENKLTGQSKLILENKNHNAAWIRSHSDYYDIYIGTKKSFYEDQKKGEDASFGGEAEDYLIDLDPGMYQMIFWNDDGPESMSFNDKEEFVVKSIANYWGEDGFDSIEDYDDVDDWYDKEVIPNIDNYYEQVKNMINNSYPDGDSANGVVLLVDGNEVAGADNGDLVNFF